MIKGLFSGVGTLGGIKHFKISRGIAPRVLWTAMFGCLCLVILGVLGKDNPNVLPLAYLIVGIIGAAMFGTWIFSHFNPHDSLEGKIRSDHLVTMRNLNSKDRELIEGSAEVVRNPAALQAEKKTEGGDAV